MEIVVTNKRGEVVRATVTAIAHGHRLDERLRITRSAQ
ncbi:hypothetical protein D777_02259 [Marinobacter nitratireducens]|uniref:Uncharacterized protein n=1 Tax=Marinobacter nitratireducens TaxID=1137280 RepID=A0A072N0V6_9GAMM|nr:hypothetical protein D777_02259 [Marinobacter nitratireducens]